MCPTQSLTTWHTPNCPSVRFFLSQAFYTGHVAHSKASPLRVGVKDLSHQPGAMRELTLDIAAPEQYGTAIAVVSEGSPMTVELRLEGLQEGILATAEVHTEATASCVRCLDSFTFEHRVDFRELFAYSGDEPDSYTVDHDALELESVIRDAVVLELPFQPTCSPQCFGLDPATGEKRDAPASEASEDAIDPRWQELAKLLEDKNPESS